MDGVLKKISISKKKEVLEPSKYYTEINEKIIKYEFRNNFIYEHYDKKGRLVVKIKRGIINIKNIKFLKILKNSNFKKSFDEMTHFSKKKKISKEDIETLKLLKKFYKQPPIIIGGCGRSGTTLLLSILSSHSKIYGIKDETYAFFPNPFRLKKILFNLKLKKNKLCWLEKTPKNVLAFKKIFRLFDGKVKLINIVRDAKSVIQSKHPNSKKKYYVNLSRWKNEVKSGYNSRNISYTLIFEKLLENPKSELKKLCKFLELKFESRLLKYHKFTSVKKNIAWGNKKVKSIDTIANRNYNFKINNVLKKYYKDKEAVKLNNYYGFK